MSHNFNEVKFWSKVKPFKTIEDCWIWNACRDKLGYGRCFINGKSDKAYRIAWMLVYGVIPNGLSVCHKCDNPSCINPFHLFLGTQSENTIDRHVKGRSRGPAGELHGQRKISKKQAMEIRSAKGLQRDIAKKYRITQTQVSKIKLGQVWR